MIPSQQHSEIWTDILCCPICHERLDFMANQEERGAQLSRCSNCATEFPGIGGSFDFVITGKEEELERDYYQEAYLSRMVSKVTNFDPEYWSRRWADPHWPEGSLILNQIGDMKDKVILCLGNGPSTKELYFLYRGARVICSDLSMSGVLAAKSKYDLGELASCAAFHAMDACRTSVKDQSVDVVYGYEFVHHLDDLDMFFQEVYRVLKPGGMCIFFDCAYSNLYQGAKNKLLWPLMKLSHMLHKRSPEDLRASNIGGYKELSLQEIGKRHGFDRFFFERVMFFQYLAIRGIGAIFGWRLPQLCYRFPGLVGRILDRIITDRLELFRRNRIGLVWAFHKKSSI